MLPMIILLMLILGMGLPGGARLRLQRPRRYKSDPDDRADSSVA